MKYIGYPNKVADGWLVVGGWGKRGKFDDWMSQLSYAHQKQRWPYIIISVNRLLGSLLALNGQHSFIVNYYCDNTTSPHFFDKLTFACITSHDDIHTRTRTRTCTYCAICACDNMHMKHLTTCNSHAHVHMYTSHCFSPNLRHQQI